MKTISLIILSFFMTSISFADKRLDLNEFSWAKKLKEQKVERINFCGNAEINLFKRSLRKDFLMGNPQRGYLLSELIAYNDYWKMLETKTLAAVKLELEKKFNQTTLWEVKGDEVLSLGKPTKIEFNFKVSIKDCFDKGKNSYGADCSKYTDKKQCCTEKFPGMHAIWKIGEKEFTLMYSPDPSVRLRVPGESAHRYCQVVTPVRF